MIAGWPAGWLAGVAGSLAGWLVGWLAALAGWLAGWLADWPAGRKNLIRDSGGFVFQIHIKLVVFLIRKGSSLTSMWKVNEKPYLCR